MKSHYVMSIICRIMNRYVQCSSHLFSYPATGAVTCVHTQLRATVSSTMPSIDPSQWNLNGRRNRCTCAELRRDIGVVWWSCIVRYQCSLCGLLLRGNMKVLVNFHRRDLCARRESRRQRYSEERESVGAGADTWLLVSVARRTDAMRRRKYACTDC